VEFRHFLPIVHGGRAGTRPSRNYRAEKMRKARCEPRARIVAKQRLARGPIKPRSRASREKIEAVRSSCISLGSAALDNPREACNFLARPKWQARFSGSQAPRERRCIIDLKRDDSCRKFTPRHVSHSRRPLRVAASTNESPRSAATVEDASISNATVLSNV